MARDRLAAMRVCLKYHLHYGPILLTNVLGPTTGHERRLVRFPSTLGSTYAHRFCAETTIATRRRRLGPLSGRTGRLISMAAAPTKCRMLEVTLDTLPPRHPSQPLRLGTQCLPSTQRYVPGQVYYTPQSHHAFPPSSPDLVSSRLHSQLQ